MRVNECALYGRPTTTRPLESFPRELTDEPLFTLVFDEAQELIENPGRKGLVVVLDRVMGVILEYTMVLLSVAMFELLLAPKRAR